MSRRVFMSGLATLTIALAWVLALASPWNPTELAGHRSYPDYYVQAALASSSSVPTVVDSPAPSRAPVASRLIADRNRYSLSSLTLALLPLAAFSIFAPSIRVAGLLERVFPGLVGR